MDSNGHVTNSMDPVKTSDRTMKDSVVSLMSASQKGQTDIVCSLLDQRLDVDSLCTDKTTALMLACQEGHTHTVSLLLRHRAQVNLQDNEGMTALLLACQAGHTDTVNLLVNSKADANIHSHSDITPLTVASQNGYADIVALLLAKGALPDIEDSAGHFPLLVASTNGHRDVLELLLGQKANVNMQNKQGYTALMGACFREQKDCVELLIKHCADTTLQRSNGTTAVAIAREKRNFQIEHILVDGQKMAKNAPNNSAKRTQYGTSRSVSVPQPQSRRLLTSSRAILSCDDHSNGIIPPTTVGSDSECTIPYKATTSLERLPINIQLPPNYNDANIHLHVHLETPTTQYTHGLMMSHHHVEAPTASSYTHGPTMSHHHVETPITSYTHGPTMSHHHVETPTTMANGSLCLSQLQAIQTSLWDSRPVWDRLGLQLELAPATIEVIKKQNPSDIDQCFTEMLTRWLKGEDRSTPTLESLVKALQSPPVSRSNLIERVTKALESKD